MTANTGFASSSVSYAESRRPGDLEVIANAYYIVDSISQWKSLVYLKINNTYSSA